MANNVTLFNYIGGKSWLREQLRKELKTILKSNNLSSYTEPFAGGLGAFLNIYDILLDNNIKNITLNDINPRIINFYNIVKNNPNELINSYLSLESKYLKTIPVAATSLNKTKDKDKLKKLLADSEAFYKKIRDSFNSPQKPLDSATHLLFLQNHCFNGVYRENSKGLYNTPYNWESKSFDKEKIKEKILVVNKIFSLFNINFTSNSFENLDYNQDTLYYIDPPYINENMAENKYSSASFSINEQKLLIKKLINTSFVYSNHFNEDLIKEFKNNKIKIKIQKIPRKNIISSSVSSRSIDKMEMLISSKK